MDFKKEIINALKKEINQDINFEEYLEVPPDHVSADYAFPCFSLAGIYKKNPVEISKELVNKIKSEYFSVKAEGPYLNFFLNKKFVAEEILKQILKEKENYGNKKENKKIVIESPGPNTNKPLHLGHLRNMVLGLSLSNIYKKTGNKVINVDIVNDRGVHICKSMLAYKKFGKNKKPDKKPDHFVGDFYVLYSKKLNEKDEEINEMLRKWESNDKDTINLWKKMNSWAIKGINETYKRFGIKINKTYYESNYYKKGKELVLKGYKKEIFKKNKDNAVYADLKDKNLGNKILLRSDGTSVYVTQDLSVAVQRYNDFKMDKMIYIVANEQIYHFKVLFEVLKMLGYKFVSNYYHLPYGMIYLPEGKMKSREGTVVDADSLMDDMTELAKKELEKRYKNISKKELEKRSEIIGLAAIKYFILNHDPLKDFVYNPKESISFEGNTGPYLLYTYARASSILRKSRKKPVIKIKDISDEEYLVIKKLYDFKETVGNSAEKYDPALLANYAFELAKLFNEFYHESKVIGSEREQFLLSIVLAFKYVLKSALNLLSMETLEKM
ncbi:arginine--tRNA ligase [Candidatus Woesearchaeota archaeon]|nr:arginine--tRNA ligase [Candidatus Woesearchaeota archaeon]